MKHIGFIAALVVVALLTTTPVWAGDHECEVVGGMLMTNINVIAGETNLGPVTGDLQGSIAATIKGQDAHGNYLVQHYWVTSSGETIVLKEAVLIPVATSDRTWSLCSGETTHPRSWVEPANSRTPLAGSIISASPTSRN